ncbi:MAG: GntR family transcriptional regulator, partial [Granulosicoccus sp.]|nr:GntR family transcriptional regulator [Granulosicoccus sp.]
MRIRPGWLYSGSITPIDQPIARIGLDNSATQGTATESVTGQPDRALLQLREFIDSGGYAPGDRLPAERQLINSLGITRNALRKGLDELEREGAIWRHVGKGTFITAQENAQAFSGLQALSNQVTPIQMMRARLALEPAIAREAAANASAEALQKILSARDRS